MIDDRSPAAARGRWVVVVLAGTLGACSVPVGRAPAPAPIEASTPSEVARPAPVPAPPAGAPRPAEPPVAVAPPTPSRGRPAPIADRRIDLTGRCAQAEEDGFREDAVLKVRDNQVEDLSWQLWVGRKGGCRFEHADFRQTRHRPHIELQARDGSACKLMVWQDPRRVTLAHANCQRWCSGGIYEQAWPVMFDPASGGCANTVR